MPRVFTQVLPFNPSLNVLILTDVHSTWPVTGNCSRSSTCSFSHTEQNHQPSTSRMRPPPEMLNTAYHNPAHFPDLPYDDDTANVHSSSNFNTAQQSSRPQLQYTELSPIYTDDPHGSEQSPFPQDERALIRKEKKKAKGESRKNKKRLALAAVKELEGRHPTGPLHTGGRTKADDTTKQVKQNMSTINKKLNATFTLPSLPRHASLPPSPVPVTKIDVPLPNPIDTIRRGFANLPPRPAADIPTAPRAMLSAASTPGQSSPHFLTPHYAAH